MDFMIFLRYKTFVVYIFILSILLIQYMIYHISSKIFRNVDNVHSSP